MRDDEPGEPDAPRPAHDAPPRDSLDSVLHHVFAAALDLTSALQYVDDERGVAQIRAAVDLLDEATRKIRAHSLHCDPGLTDPA